MQGGNSVDRPRLMKKKARASKRAFEDSDEQVAKEELPVSGRDDEDLNETMVATTSSEI